MKQKKCFSWEWLTLQNDCEGPWSTSRALNTSTGTVSETGESWLSYEALGSYHGKITKRTFFVGIPMELTTRDQHKSRWIERLPDNTSSCERLFVFFCFSVWPSDMQLRCFTIVGRFFYMTGKQVKISENPIIICRRKRKGQLNKEQDKNRIYRNYKRKDFKEATQTVVKY